MTSRSLQGERNRGSRRRSTVFLLMIGGSLGATCLPSLLCLRVAVCVEIDRKLVSLHTRVPSIPVPHKQMSSSLQGCARCKLLQGTKCKAWVRMPPTPPSSQPSLYIEPYGHCPLVPPPPPCLSCSPALQGRYSGLGLLGTSGS